jgi:hypothetical protein
MAYYIFLKSFRSLEEFRKNPHVKIPPKSPSTNFQSLAIIKNQFLFEKEFFFTFGPERPSGQSAHPASQPGHSPWCPPPPVGRARVLDPSRPTRPWRYCQKPPLLRVCAARRLRLSLCHRHTGPTCQLRHLPHAADPGRDFPAPLPRALDAPELLQLSLITSPTYSPSNRALTALNTFNGVNAINAGVNRPGHPSPLLPRPL